MSCSVFKSQVSVTHSSNTYHWDCECVCACDIINIYVTYCLATRKQKVGVQLCLAFPKSFVSVTHSSKSAHRASSKATRLFVTNVIKATSIVPLNGLPCRPKKGAIHTVTQTSFLAGMCHSVYCKNMPKVTRINNALVSYLPLNGLHCHPPKK